MLKLKTSSGFGHLEVGVGAKAGREETVCGDTGGGPSPGLEDFTGCAGNTQAHQTIGEERGFSLGSRSQSWLSLQH